jgi:hypothetical protein
MKECLTESQKNTVPVCHKYLSQKPEPHLRLSTSVGRVCIQVDIVIVVVVVVVIIVDVIVVVVFVDIVDR